MLTHAAIAQLRLQNQQIARSRFTAPHEVVAWHGAMQAQDYTHAKWAVGLRLPNATDQTIEQAIDAGTIVRTHILRPTWHLVAAADVRWMMRLTAPQIDALSRAMQRDLGLDAATFRRTNDVIVRALEGGRQLTRQELAEAIERAGIPTNSSRMVYIMFSAELEALVCNGSRRGKEQTYALLDERIPPSPMLERDEVLAELARRYFTSHAPATVQDFIWWSGLKVGDAKAGLDMIKSDLVSMHLDHLTYWIPKDTTIPANIETAVYLLPAFDEYTISYRERGASLDPSLAAQTITSNGIFKPIVVVNGRVAGVWSRTEKRTSVLIEPQLFATMEDVEREGISQAAKRFGAFLGKEALMN